MKKINLGVFIVTVLMFSAVSYADVNANFDVFAVCKKVDYSFSHEEDKCFKEMKGVKFIQNSAVEVCSTLSFDNEKTNCLKALINKKYTPTEVEFCGDKSFDNQVVSCLKEQGQAYYGEISDSEKLSQARLAARKLKRQLTSGQILRALATLDELLWILQ